jgi:ABC-type multidrug transport system permease subunit
MALLFVAIGFSDDIWKEKEMGTLNRLAISPTGPISFLFGKIVSTSVLMAIIALLVLGLGCWYHGLNFASMPIGLLFSVFSGTVLFLVMLAIQLFAPSHKSGSILVGAIMFPLLMLGGSFFPSEVMPGWMGAIGKWTPNGLSVEFLKDILLSRVEFNNGLVAVGFLGLMGLFSFFLILKQLRGFATK